MEERSWCPLSAPSTHPGSATDCEQCESLLATPSMWSTEAIPRSRFTMTHAMAFERWGGCSVPIACSSLQWITPINLLFMILLNEIYALWYSYYSYLWSFVGFVLLILNKIYRCAPYKWRTWDGEMTIASSLSSHRKKTPIHLVPKTHGQYSVHQGADKFQSP